MIRQQIIEKHSSFQNNATRHPLDNQDGAAIVLVLMVLAIMTVIGIVSSDTVVTENFIVRNVGINKQNENLVESALMQGLQEFMQIDDSDADNFDPASATWINDVDDDPTANPLANNNRWYETSFASRCLSAANSNNANTNATTLNDDNYALLTTRGEAGNGNLRYAVIGYTPVDLGTSGSESLVVGSSATWYAGRIVAEYVSANASNNDNGFGLLRMEIGVKRKW